MSQKHPLILHRKDPLAQLICRHVHQNNLHADRTGLIGLLSLEYHIMGAKHLVKEVSKTCVTCQKNYALTTDQLMGQLPPSRATPAPAFTSTGVDFAGPFTLRKGHTRRPVWVKGYECIFICLTTKAVHVELVMDLSTDSFVAAFKRFVSRRGQPAVIMTDNGTNFVSARRQLQEAYQWLTRQENRETLSQYLFKRKIQWLHTPA